MNQRDQKFLGKIKLIVAVILLIVLAIFTIQNMAEVELTVLFWKFEARRVVVIGLSFLIGLTIGWIMRGHRRPQEH